MGETGGQNDWGREVGSVLPEGTVTLLLADVEGSTRLWEHEPDVMAAALARLSETVDEVVGRHGGARPVEQGEGDSFVLAFTRASDAASAALDLQRAELDPLRLRIGIHTGEVQLRDEDNYMGPAVNRAARLRDLGHGGQTLISQATHDIVVERLPGKATVTDLGVHRLKDLARPEHVHQLGHPELPTEFPPLRSVDSYLNNLPVQLTSFIGRQTELAELRALLAEHRLVTLTGSGGAGKTRLALQLAAEVLADFPDDVWHADLAPIADPELLAGTAGRAMGLQDEINRTTVETITHHVGSNRVLLVLDNCEHLLRASADLADALLRACPVLTIVSTTREPLGVGGEVSWRIPSLTLPEGSDAGDSEAVALFTDRARRARAGFVMTADNAGAVREICARLDGIPLAIELAAARVRVFSPDQIAVGLHDRFRLLTGGVRTALQRQQTLRASVDWSHDLLNDLEKVLFRRLAAFAGSYDLAAIEAVGGGGDVETHHVRDLLTSLVDKSLVLASDHQDTRYSMLETVRQYALDQLSASGEGELVRRRHRDHYLAVAQVAGLGSMSLDSRMWMLRLETELDNLRVAFEWSRGIGDAEEALSLACLPFMVWAGRGRALEGRAWLDAALAESAAVSPEVRMLALAASAQIEGALGSSRALARGDEAVALARALGEDAGLALALIGAAAYRQVVAPTEAQDLLLEAAAAAQRSGLGMVEATCHIALGLGRLWHGDHAGARAFADQALAHPHSKSQGHQLLVVRAGAMLWRGEIDASRRLLQQACAEAAAGDDQYTLPYAQFFGALAAAMMNDSEGAERLTRECAPVFAATGMQHMAAGHVQIILGMAALAAGDVGLGIARLREAGEWLTPDVDIWNALRLALVAEATAAHGDPRSARDIAADAVARAEVHGAGWQRTVALVASARVAVASDDLDAADDFGQHALAAAARIGDQANIASALEVMLVVAAETDPARAARLGGAADAIRQRTGAARSTLFEPACQRSVTVARAALGDDTFDAAWAEGAALSMDEAVAYAQRGRGERKRPSAGWASLTPAELDVVRLVADGLPNKDIAERLFISPRTVQSHLTHVYAKLGVSSRVQLSNEAARHS